MLQFGFFAGGAALLAFGACATLCASLWRDWKSAEAEVSRLEAELALYRQVDAQTRRVEKEFSQRQRALEDDHARATKDLEDAGALSGLELYEHLDRLLCPPAPPAGGRAAAPHPAGAGAGTAAGQ